MTIQSSHTAELIYSLLAPPLPSSFAGTVDSARSVLCPRAIYQCLTLACPFCFLPWDLSEAVM